MPRRRQGLAAWAREIAATEFMVEVLHDAACTRPNLRIGHAETSGWRAVRRRGERRDRPTALSEALAESCDGLGALPPERPRLQKLVGPRWRSVVRVVISPNRLHIDRLVRAGLLCAIGGVSLDRLVAALLHPLKVGWRVTKGAVDLPGVGIDEVTLSVDDDHGHPVPVNLAAFPAPPVGRTCARLHSPRNQACHWP